MTDYTAEQIRLKQIREWVLHVAAAPATRVVFRALMMALERRLPYISGLSATYLMRDGLFEGLSALRSPDLYLAELDGPGGPEDDALSVLLDGAAVRGDFRAAMGRLRKEMITETNQCLKQSF